MLIAIILLAAWAILTLVVPLVSAVRVARAQRQLVGLVDRISRLAEELARVRSELDALKGAAGASASEPSWPGPVADPVEPVAPPVVETVAPASGGAGAGTQPTSLETRIGARWLLYVGIATLILGASYFVRYAFENNWVTPVMRVILGGAAGAALAEAGRRFSVRGLKVYGQILAGGGVAILYVATYAALELYGLLAPWAAFAIMVAITAFAAWRARAEASEGLAVLAVAGGFATPFLVGNDSASPHLLFTYDTILVLATLWLTRRDEWPLLRLASFALTGLTVLAWSERHYTSERWWSTELWLTLFAVLFSAIASARPPADSNGTPARLAAWRRDAERVARALLSLTPVVYHAASLTILWTHPAGLLVYLIAATALGTIIAVHTCRPWIRLVTWTLVAPPTLNWLFTRPESWDTAPFVVVFGIYAIHLAASWMAIPRRPSGWLTAERADAPPPTIELLLLHLNGLWLWGGLAILLERLLLAQLGPVTFAVAAWHMALAGAAARRDRETALHVLALAGALVAAGVAIELDGAALTVAWAVEGAALTALGLTARRGWLQAGGGMLLGVAVTRLVGELLQPAATASLPVLNARTFSASVVVTLIGYLAWRYRARSGQGVSRSSRLVATLVVTAALLPLLWASSEVTALFARSAWIGEQATGAGAVTSARLARDVSLSTLWAAHALLLVGIGISRQYAPLRVLAIALFAVSAAKVFFVDLSRFDRGYRILSTVALGLLLLGASYLYQRFTRQESRPS